MDCNFLDSNFSFTNYLTWVASGRVLGFVGCCHRQEMIGPSVCYPRPVGLIVWPHSWCIARMGLCFAKYFHPRGNWDHGLKKRRSSYLVGSLVFVHGHFSPTMVFFFCLKQNGKIGSLECTSQVLVVSIIAEEIAKTSLLVFFSINGKRY